MDACGLMDIGMEGYEFTWERHRGTENWVEERLDWALASSSWITMFGRARVFNVPVHTSDHSAIFLDLMVFSRVLKKRRFCFENAWVKENKCREIIETRAGRSS